MLKVWKPPPLSAILIKSAGFDYLNPLPRSKPENIAITNTKAHAKLDPSLFQVRGDFVPFLFYFRRSGSVEAEPKRESDLVRNLSHCPFLNNMDDKLRRREYSKRYYLV